ncbi:hypothetical protein V1502_02235 [Bacillus sp. SCS-153A]|uniref:hypothetical protein n=1 Tax=Rossellomorea sedimentorum TaxID=3115294 RepID=UPI003905880B
MTFIFKAIAGILSITVLLSCSSEKTVIMEERSGQGYQELQKISSAEEIKEFTRFLDGLRWQNETQVMMLHSADYRFILPSPPEEKGDWEYRVWLTPKKALLK